jgi:hypothetical protein
LPGNQSTESAPAANFVSGTGARRPAVGLTIAATLTAATPALVANLALELAPIRVNLIAPGFVDTPLSASLLGDSLEKRRQQTAGDFTDRSRGRACRCGRARRPPDDQFCTDRCNLRESTNRCRRPVSVSEFTSPWRPDQNAIDLGPLCPETQALFGMAPISSREWLAIGIFASGYLGLAELAKRAYVHASVVPAAVRGSRVSRDQPPAGSQ